MKILIINYMETKDPGGINRVVIETAKNMAKMGHEVIVLQPNPSNHPGEEIFEGFKNFILRGNAVDLAVGVVIGAAFNGVVQAIVKDLLTPLITLNFSKFNYIDFFNNLISFLLVAVAVYFFVVLPMNAVLADIKPDKRTSPSVAESDAARDRHRLPRPPDASSAFEQHYSVSTAML